MNPSTLLALLANGALPGYTAYRYAQYALAPGSYDDAYAYGLVTLFFAQLPLCLLGAVFAGVSYIEGPSWRRVLIYLVIIGVVAIIAAVARVSLDEDYGPIIGYAVAMQIVLLMFVGEQPALALARIDAVTNDAANLIVLSIWGGVVAIVAALALQQYGRGKGEWHDLEFEMTDIAWIGVVYFALRAWSAIYAYTPAFEVRRKGFFTRPWLEKVVTLGKKPPSKEDY
ncbi:MAG: hypothetical protein ABI624_09975 [Casimicrobiaceae bacterium]